MHAFLVVGTRSSEIEKIVDQKVNEFEGQKFDLSVSKIDQARELSSYAKLSGDKIFVLRNIDRATTPALNAILKILEEPDDGVFFVLTCENERRVLPTIVSRCEVIHSKNKNLAHANDKFIANFIKMKESEKINFAWKLKDRDEALEFIYELVEFTHRFLAKSKNPKYASTILEKAEGARGAIEAYGNFKLHLLCFVVSIHE